MRRLGSQGLAFAHEFRLAGLEPGPQSGHVDPRLLGFREDAGARLLLFADADALGRKPADIQTDFIIRLLVRNENPGDSELDPENETGS